MFTGIVKELCRVKDLYELEGMIKFSIELPLELSSELQEGASIAINGVCLTIVKYNQNLVWFDVIHETLEKTNLKRLKKGSLVNVERSLKWGDEVGGHLVSGHIFGEVLIKKISKTDNNCSITFLCNHEWVRYLMPKGYIALDGVSLTIAEVNRELNSFSVHLIPETLNRTTFGLKKQEDWVNIEFDSQTQSIVETIERIMNERNASC